MPTHTMIIRTSDSAVLMCNELRKSLITWAQNQATGQRTQAAIGHTAKHHDRCTAKAESFDFMVKYLEGVEIVQKAPPPKPIRMCPDTNTACEENCGIPDCYLKLSKAGFFDVN